MEYRGGKQISYVLQFKYNQKNMKCPEVGTVSQGKSIEEAIKNLKEATELYLEEFPIKKATKPFVTFFEVTSHAKTSKAIRA